MFKPSSEIVLLTIPGQCFFCESVLLFMLDVRLYSYYTVLYVPFSLVTTYWERADLLALLCVMFPCVFGTVSYGVSCKVWFLIISIPDLCLLLNS